MKSIVKILSLAGMLLLGSCSKDTSAPVIEPVEEKLSSGIYLSGTLGLDELRALEHSLEVSGSRNSEVWLNYPAGSGSYTSALTFPKRKLQASLVGRVTQVLCILKSDDASQPVSYIYIPVLNLGDKSFEIDSSVDIALSPGTNLNSGNWYIMGFIYSSGKSSGQTIRFNESTKRLEVSAPSISTTNEFDASTETGSKLTAPSVYMFDWVPLTIEAVGGRVAAKLTSRARLMPQGTLYVLEISNISQRHTSSEQDWAVFIRNEAMTERVRVGRPYIVNGQDLETIMPEQIYNDANNPMYSAVDGVDFFLSDDGGTLDGYYDLSESHLNVTRTPELRMGAVNEMKIRFPEIRYYFRDRHKEMPVYWVTAWIAPNPSGDATAPSRIVPVRTTVGAPLTSTPWWGGYSQNASWGNLTSAEFGGGLYRTSFRGRALSGKVIYKVVPFDLPDGMPII